MLFEWKYAGLLMYSVASRLSSDGWRHSPAEQVRVGEEVRVHLEERAALEDEGGQHHLGEVHANLDLQQNTIPLLHQSNKIRRVDSVS